jgi:hypothetical protein
VSILTILDAANTAATVDAATDAVAAAAPAGVPADASTGAAECPLPAVVGSDLLVPLADGRQVPYANLDYAASAPCLEPVRAAVAEALPAYSSVHRGAGYASRLTTARYERARHTVRAFAGARPGDAVVFTRNTTDAMNLLARCLPEGTTVVVFDSEHHASLLPWPRAVRLAPPASPGEAVRAADEALAAIDGPKLLVVTAASNVTGELWPIAALAHVAHERGARIAVDAAQYAPHRRLAVAALDLDYVAFSGHKLYAPFGAGALVGRPDWLAQAEPYLRGGGATRNVADEVEWSTDPEQRHEAGTPTGPRSCGTRSGSPPGCAPACPRGCGSWRCGGRTTPASAWCRSPWPGTPPARWPRSSAPSTASACATAGSAPTRSCARCSARRATARTGPAPRSAPRSASAPPRSTSTGSSRRSTTSCAADAAPARPRSGTAGAAGNAIEELDKR